MKRYFFCRMSKGNKAYCHSVSRGNKAYYRSVSKGNKAYFTQKRQRKHNYFRKYTCLHGNISISWTFLFSLQDTYFRKYTCLMATYLFSWIYLSTRRHTYLRKYTCLTATYLFREHSYSHGKIPNFVDTIITEIYLIWQNLPCALRLSLLLSG